MTTTDPTAGTPARRGKTAGTAVAEAPGKVNLTLEMLGRREDGYHELRSVVMPVSLFETVTVSERSDGAVTCETEGDGVDVSQLRSLPAEKQLCVKAVRAMQRALGRDGSRCGCDVRVVKRVPIGAGMGGGSADAAGVLACLRALWAPDIAEKDWLAAGAAVGSDVPALQLGGAVLMEGRGERVRRLFAPESGIPPMWLVALFPGECVSTKAVYEAFDRESGGSAFAAGDLTEGRDPCENCARSVRNGDAEACARALFNGLQDTVFRLHPSTERFCLALGEGGALGTLLSGSGSAVFGLARSRESAEAIRRSVPGEVWGKVLRTLPDGVMAAHGPLVP